MHGWVWRKRYMSRFCFSYLVILMLLFLVNGVLTGSGIGGEIVWYNNAENLGLRIGTVPVEDLFYGLLLILMCVDLFEYFERKKPRDLYCKKL
jgi:lycopene cyclase domain-containing protein